MSLLSEVENAIEDNEAKKVDAWLKKGGNVNSCFTDGHSLLTLACHWGHCDIIELLCSKPSLDVNAVSTFNDEQGEWTENALSFAADRGHAKVVEFFISNTDADINARSGNRGYSALIKAADHGHNEVARVLLSSSRIDVNLVSDSGLTALIKAACRGHLEIVEMLLSHPGIEVNKSSEHFASALVNAAGYGHLIIVQRLLEIEDIDVHSVSPITGNTALICASENNHFEIKELLMRDIMIRQEMIKHHQRDMWRDMWTTPRSGKIGKTY